MASTDSIRRARAGTPGPPKEPPSPTGKEARFGDCAAEVSRIVVAQGNYYTVLKVEPTSSQAITRGNFQRLQQVIDPGQCDDALVDAALGILKKAYETLTTPWRKGLYDQFQKEGGKDQVFEVWMQKRSSVPSWVQMMLECPCGAPIGILIFTPITLLLACLSLIIGLIRAPFQQSEEDVSSEIDDDLYLGRDDSESQPRNAVFVKIEEGDKENEDMNNSSHIFAGVNQRHNVEIAAGGVS